MNKLSEQANIIAKEANVLTSRLIELEQIAPTEPGAPLSDAVSIAKKALTELSCLGNGEHPGNSIGNDIAKRAIKDIDAILAKRKVRKEEPAALDGNMIEKAVKAWAQETKASAYVMDTAKAGMTAASLVIADALLGIVRAKLSLENKWHIAFIDKFIEEVRARIEAKPKTLQERIEERFRMARDNGDAYTPDALADIAVEELEKENHG